MKAIWSIDNQNDFIEENGLLAVKDARSIRPNLAKIMGLARRKKMFIIHTTDWHNSNSQELSDKPDFKNTFPKHCMAHTEGANIIPETNPLGSFFEIGYEHEATQERVDESEREIRNNDCYEFIIRKDKFDVFEGNPDTQKIVNMMFQKFNFDTAFVCGVATNVCVNFAVLGLLKNNKKVYIIEDAIKELPNLPVKELFEDWKKKGVIFCKTNELENLL